MVFLMGVVPSPNLYLAAAKVRNLRVKSKYKYLIQQIPKVNHIYMMELRNLLLDLQLCFMNYDSVFRSYNWLIQNKIALSMQRKSGLYIEESQCYWT